MDKGWIIGLLITGEECAYTLFAVAEPDREAAAAIVAEATASTREANEVVEVVGPVSGETLRVLGLTDQGDLRSIT